MSSTTQPPKAHVERRSDVRRRSDRARSHAAERALLLAHSLAAANYQNRTEKEGIRQFLNCIQLVLQEPLAVLVLRKDPGQQDDFIVLYHTLLDPLVKTHFETYLFEEFSAYAVEHNLFVPAHQFSDRVFKIHAHYYVALIRLIDFDREINHPSKFEFVLNSHQDAQLREYLSYFSDRSHLLSYFVSDELSQAFDSRAQARYWSEGKIKLRELSTDLHYDFMGEQQYGIDYEIFFQDQFEKIKLLFDDAYEAIRDSSLLKYNDIQPPNIMFALRMFDRTNPRVANSDYPQGIYPYGVRGLIPKKQRQEMTRALETLRRMQRDRQFERLKYDAKARRFYFPKPKQRRTLYDQLTEDDFPANGNACFGGDSEFFWQKILSDEDFEKIFCEIEQGYGDRARALSDMVFCSGVVSVAQNPFTETRGMRMCYEKWMNGERDTDYRRLVYYHYLMSMAAPGAGSVSALITPGRVGGCAWFSMGFCFTDKEPEQDRWLKCYHFYHNVATYFTRSIRISAKRLYLKELKSLFYQLIDIAIPTSYPNLGLEYYVEMINPYCRLLCRVYPFRQILLQHVPEPELTGGKDEFYAVIRGKPLFFRVQLVDNPYFESTTDATYVRMDEVVDSLGGHQFNKVN